MDNVGERVKFRTQRAQDLAHPRFPTRYSNQPVRLFEDHYQKWGKLNVLSSACCFLSHHVPRVHRAKEIN